jgi:hypothetical protein
MHGSGHHVKRADCNDVPGNFIIKNNCPKAIGAQHMKKNSFLIP